MAQLGRLLDDEQVALAAPVRLELLAGASRAMLPRLRRLLSALPVFYPTEATWGRLDAFVERAVGAGERFGFGDLMIGAICSEQGGVLWSHDADFRRMARLGLVRLHG